MDSRRFDRNADQLSQILWHFTKLQKQQFPNNVHELDKMLELLQFALQLNDDIAALREKGLI